jgi:hypothetical protein
MKKMILKVLLAAALRPLRKKRDRVENVRDEEEKTMMIIASDSSKHDMDPTFYRLPSM